MSTISGTLIAVIMAGEGSAPEPPTLAELTSTAEARAIAATATQAAYTPTPIPLPDYLRERFEALPDRLRDPAITALNQGRWDAILLAEIIEDAGPDGSVRVGPVLETGDGFLRMEVLTTGRTMVAVLGYTTPVTRYDQRIELDDLEENELIRVVFQPNTLRAERIEAFGIPVPEGAAD